MANEGLDIKGRMESLSNELNQINQTELKSLKESLAQMKKIHSYIPECVVEPWGFFRLFRRSADELTHSYILAYLLDPNRPHGLGDFFLKEFIKLLLKRKPLCIEYDNSYVEVNTEVPFGDRRVDIIVEMENSAIVIENKVYNLEGEGQTTDIEKEVKKGEGYHNKDCIYVILSPKGINAKNPIFIAVSYTEIAEILRGLPFSITSSIPFKTSFLLAEFSNHIKEEFEMSREEWKLDDKSRLYLEYQKEISDIIESFEGYIKNVLPMVKDIAISSLQADDEDEWVYYTSRSHYQQLYKKDWSFDNQYYMFFETWLDMEHLAKRKFIFIMGTHDGKIRNKFDDGDPSTENELKAFGSRYRPKDCGFAIAYKEYVLNDDLTDLKDVIEKAYREHAFLVDKIDRFFNNSKANIT